MEPRHLTVTNSNSAHPLKQRKGECGSKGDRWQEDQHTPNMTWPAGTAAGILSHTCVYLCVCVSVSVGACVRVYDTPLLLHTHLVRVDNLFKCVILLGLSVIDGVN